MFLYLVTCFLRVAGSLLCRSQAPTISYQQYVVQFIPIYSLFVKRVEIVRACGRHSNETVTLMKYLTKYKNKRKLTIEFHTKFESRDNKISRVNTIRIAKFINLLEFRTLLGSVTMLTFLN